MSTDFASTSSRRIVAVFGSAAQGATGARTRHPARPGSFSPNAAAVFERVLALITARVPEIAGPIVDRGVAQGEISRSERHALLAELAADGAVGRPAAGASSPAGAKVRGEALAAISREAPRIARPLLDEAVASERLTSAQERRIIERLQAGQTGSVSFSK